MEVSSSLSDVVIQNVSDFRILIYFEDKLQRKYIDAVLL